MTKDQPEDEAVTLQSLMAQFEDSRRLLTDLQAHVAEATRLGQLSLQRQSLDAERDSLRVQLADIALTHLALLPDALGPEARTIAEKLRELEVRQREMSESIEALLREGDEAAERASNAKP